MNDAVDRELLDFAVTTATAAGRLAADLFHAGAPARTKADGTEVTDADLAVEDFIRTELARRTPDDAVLGEEAGLSAGTSGRRWVVDPISGTAYFTRRMPLFATLLAYEDEHGPAIGVITSPLARETVFAARGLGCWVQRDGGDPHRTRIGDRTDLDGALTLASNQHTFSEELLAALHQRTALVGGIHHPLLHLLTGRVDAVVMTCQSYDDLAAAPVLLAEAGGAGTTLDGGPVLSAEATSGIGTLLASNPLLHHRLLEITHGLRAVRGPKGLPPGRTATPQAPSVPSGKHS